MTTQNVHSLRKAQETREMAAEISRLRSVVSELTREKQELKDALQITPELHDMISQLHERDRQFKDALRKSVGALKTAIASLEDLIEQDVETASSTAPDELSMSTSEYDDSVPPPPLGVHVVKEGHFRWRQMLLLSDGTIEVDTPAGRLRFVDQLHVEEYFDAHWPLPEK